MCLCVLASWHCRKCSCFGEFAIFIGTQSPHKAYKNSPSSAAGYKSDVWSCDLRAVGLCLTVVAGGCCCCSWWDVVEPVSGTLTDWCSRSIYLTVAVGSALWSLCFGSSGSSQEADWKGSPMQEIYLRCPLRRLMDHLWRTDPNVGAGRTFVALVSCSHLSSVIHGAAAGLRERTGSPTGSDE